MKIITGKLLHTIKNTYSLYDNLYNTDYKYTILLHTKNGKVITIQTEDDCLMLPEDNDKYTKGQLVHILDRGWWSWLSFESRYKALGKTYGDDF